MKTISLTLRSRDDAEKIAELTWENGETRLVYSVDAIATDLRRMLATGLIEWVGELQARERRQTSSADVSFLERVGDYFARQSGFVIKLIEREISIKVVRASKQLVRGAVYIVTRTHHQDAIFRSMQQPNQLQANPMILSRLGPSANQREAVYRRGLFESVKASTHARN